MDPARRTVPPGCRPARGFTLVELVIAVAVVAILAVVALPAFNDAIRKSRRAEAFAALSGIQQAQERWRANRPSYTTDLSMATGIGQPSTSSGGYYTIAVGSATATSYEVTATADASKSQAQDAGCQVLAVKMDGGSLLYASGTTSVSWIASVKDPKGCWAR